ncbi:MAG: flagellar hook-basal body protein [Oscillospiraceae bacterium]|jgi:flagellar basal-body rod protein FlgG|nr:flagellar hook-basal body protein [Oscillospiraceae bacterium]
MTRGLYIAGTGMMFQRRKMETITNNITNAETVGYKRDELVSHTFDDVMIERYNDYEDSSIVSRRKAVGPLTFGVQVDQIFTDTKTIGNFEETSKTTDLLLTGGGYFVLETGEGERYSKAGAFTINSLGYLTDGPGHYLLGTEGRIFVGSDDFKVNELGEVYVNDEWVNTVRIMGFNDEGQLRKQGDNLYYDAGNGQPYEWPNDSVLKQGFLENSNVDVGREMVEMLVTYRAYETNQRMVQMIDQINGKAVNEIGRLR